MKKKTIIIIIAAVVVALALTLGIAIGRGVGRDATSTPESTPPPGLSEPQSAAPGNSQSSSATRPQTDSIPYVGPIDSPIIGRWMRDLSQYYPEQLEQMDKRTIYEFVPDGTVNTSTYHVLDEEYPENWRIQSYDYYFETWRGQEVLRTAAFRLSAHLRLEFAEENGQQVMYIVELTEDGQEVNYGRFLKQED